MHPQPSRFAHLYLLVQRVVDRELLDVEQAAELLAEADAARKMHLLGEMSMAREHALHVALFAEALVDTRTLAPWDGRALVETARSIIEDRSE